MSRIFSELDLENKLKWIIPIVVVDGLLMYLFFAAESFPTNPFLNTILVIAGIVAPIGGWWAVYQCVRYEKHPWKYIAVVVLVPIGFVWYYFERYLKREPKARPTND